MYRSLIFYLWIICFIKMVTNADAMCTFPADLRGSWTSADRGTLTFEANKLSGYSIQLTKTIGSVDFNCQTLLNNRYHLSGNMTFKIFSDGDIFRPHICLEFYKLTSEKYYYHVVTVTEPTINDRIYMNKSVNLVEHGDVCNRQAPFEVGTYIMLIKDEASDTNLAVECPNDISRNFNNVKYSAFDGTNNCSGKLEILPDRLKMNFTYNSCDNRLKFSVDGFWCCLHNINSGSTTYLATLNMDRSLVSGQTYRIVCYTLQRQDRILKATIYPGSCRPNQTATYVVSPGVHAEMYDISDHELGSVTYEAGIHVTIVSALFVTIVAVLVIIFIVRYRKKRTEYFKPCQTQENTTGRTDLSNYNVINYSEMSDISIIKINENRNEIHTCHSTQHHLQNNKTSIKQNQNICTKSLSTNQNSAEPIYESHLTRNNQCELLTKQRELDKHTYESTEFVQPPDIKTSMEQDQNICHKYKTLSTNRNSDTHIYESDLIHTNQYESSTKPPESDKHTYESIELTQPQDIEQDQHICIKYESLSTNRNSDKHIYETTHTNQYESLKKQQESDKHTYESTEHAQPHDIRISTDQEDNFCNKYESLSTNRNSVEHTYESTEQTLPVSQYQSPTNPQESDKYVYASTQSLH